VSNPPGTRVNLLSDCDLITVEVDMVPTQCAGSGCSYGHR
jgi:hypothetical protein